MPPSVWTTSVMPTVGQVDAASKQQVFSVVVGRCSVLAARPQSPVDDAPVTILVSSGRRRRRVHTDWRSLPAPSCTRPDDCSSDARHAARHQCSRRPLDAIIRITFVSRNEPKLTPERIIYISRHSRSKTAQKFQTGTILRKQLVV